MPTYHLGTVTFNPKPPQPETVKEATEALAAAVKDLSRTFETFSEQLTRALYIIENHEKKA